MAPAPARFPPHERQAGPRPGPRPPHHHRPAGNTVTVTFAGGVIAKTDRALMLEEASHPPRYYIPLDDVEPDVLEPSTHQTCCPFKGDASYYSLHARDTRAENAVWTYVAPYDAVSEIAGHVAFYPDRVEISTG
jgi:uncharacterized protein (DUF427 family)